MGPCRNGFEASPFLPFFGAASRLNLALSQFAKPICNFSLNTPFPRHFLGVPPSTSHFWVFGRPNRYILEDPVIYELLPCSFGRFKGQPGCLYDTLPFNLLVFDREVDGLPLVLTWHVVLKHPCEYS